ncbi:UNVERIFIED_CONTAM: tetratricopeptide (TPR) repeat protein [Brevibacillus sp. OAP136]
MVEKEEEHLVPYQEEIALKEKRKAALKRGDRQECEHYTSSLVALYVFYGESFKMSDRPDPYSAKKCLEKALSLQNDHPVANYRYAHLLYAERNFAKAAYYFKKALDGNRTQSLNDTQSLISQIFTVNCGILMAKEAIKEVDYLQNNRHASFDTKLIANYADRMLVDSEEMLTQYLYLRINSDGSKPISEERFFEEQEAAGDQDVLICVTQRSRELVFRGSREPLSQTEFFVAHTVLKSVEFIQVKDIYASLFEDCPLETVITPEAVRQCLRRLSNKLTFWDLVVEADTRGKYSARKRREGLRYTLLCQSNVVLPKS